MNADYRIYNARVSLLTPLHIGSGRDLLNEYDYAIKGGRTWRINENVLLDTQDIADPKVVEQIGRTPPAQLLADSDYDIRNTEGLFRYVITGTPRSHGEGAQLREQLKDSNDRPYIPGSSLKGALRTALLWYAWDEYKLRPETSQLDRRREWAGHHYERDLMGKTPNTSLMRALQVSDSQPIDTARLMVINVRVMNRIGGLGSPIEVEAVAPDSVVDGVTLKVDLALFSDWAKARDLRLDGSVWLLDLVRIANLHAKDRAQREAKWFEAIPEAKGLANLYKQLANAKLSANQFLIELGWGTGWESKTFGDRLSVDENFMERVIYDYRLARGKREQGDPFPKSRRVVMRYAKDEKGNVSESPARPMGWALVELSAA